MHGSSGRMRGVVSVVLVAALSAGLANAQLRDEDALTPLIGSLPSSARLVVVSPRPGAVLEQVKGPWKRLGPLATGAGADTLKNWSHLARRLGYGPEEAFDALTSGGLAVVVAAPAVNIKAEGEPGARGKAEVSAVADGPWTVVSVVKADVAARVREKLAAAPHEVVGGRPVMSVEDGKFALVCRALTDAEGSDEFLALTPAGDKAFLASVVDAIEAARTRRVGEAAEGTLASTGAFKIGREQKADVLLLIDEAEAAPKGTKAWAHASVVSCGMASSTWMFDVQTMGVELVDAPIKPLPPEAAAWYDAWSPTAAAMITIGTGGELEGLLRSVDPDVLQRDERLEAISFYAGSNPAGATSFWTGARICGGNAGISQTMDSMGQRLIGLAETADWPQALAGAGAKQAEKTAMSPFAGLPPTALRVASVRIPVGPSLKPGSQAESGWTAGSVAWFQCPGAAPAVVDGKNEPPRWLVWGVEPTQDGATLTARQQELARLLGSNEQPGRVWLARGVLRPSRVLDALPTPLAFAAGLSGVGAIKEVRFDAWDDPSAGAARARTRLTLEWASAADAPR